MRYYQIYCATLGVKDPGNPAGEKFLSMERAVKRVTDFLKEQGPLILYRHNVDPLFDEVGNRSDQRSPSSQVELRTLASAFKITVSGDTVMQEVIASADFQWRVVRIQNVRKAVVVDGLPYFRDAEETVVEKDWATAYFHNGERQKVQVRFTVECTMLDLEDEHLCEKHEDCGVDDALAQACKGQTLKRLPLRIRDDLVFPEE